MKTKLGGGWGIHRTSPWVNRRPHPCLPRRNVWGSDPAAVTEHGLKQMGAVFRAERVREECYCTVCGSTLAAGPIKTGKEKQKQLCRKIETQRVVAVVAVYFLTLLDVFQGKTHVKLIPIRREALTKCNAQLVARANGILKLGAPAVRKPEREFNANFDNFDS